MRCDDFSCYLSPLPPQSSHRPKMGGKDKHLMRKLEQLEEKLMEDMINDIGASEDPVDQFKAIERYHKLVLARKDRQSGDALCAPQPSK